MSKAKKPKLTAYGQEIDRATLEELARVWLDPQVCSRALVIEGYGRAGRAGVVGGVPVTCVIPIPRGYQTPPYDAGSVQEDWHFTRYLTLPYLLVVHPPGVWQVYRAHIETLRVKHMDSPGEFDVTLVANIDVAGWMLDRITGASYAGIGGCFRHRRRESARGPTWTTRITLTTRITEALRSRRSPANDKWIVSLDVACKALPNRRTTVLNKDYAQKQRHIAESPNELGTNFPAWSWDDAAYVRAWQDMIDKGILTPNRTQGLPPEKTI